MAGDIFSKTWNKSHALSLTEISFEMSSSKYRPFCLDPSVLTDWGSILHTNIIWMGHHWFRYWRVVYQARNYYLLQTWHMTYCEIRWNWNKNTFVFQRKTVQKTVCKNQQVCGSSVLTRGYWKPEDYAYPYSYKHSICKVAGCPLHFARFIYRLPQYWPNYQPGPVVFLIESVKGIQSQLREDLGFYWHEITFCGYSIRKSEDYTSAVYECTKCLVYEKAIIE